MIRVYFFHYISSPAPPPAPSFPFGPTHACSDGNTQLLWTRAVAGVAIGGGIPLVFSIMGDLVGSSRRTEASGAIGISIGIGQGLGQVLEVLVTVSRRRLELKPRYNSTVMLVVVVVDIFLSFLPCFRMLKSESKPPETHERGEEAQPLARTFAM